MKRLIAAILAPTLLAAGIVATQAEATTLPVPAPVTAPQPTAAPVIKIPPAPNRAAKLSGDCGSHGCYAATRLCLINATTWGPIATMISRWWYASYSVVIEIRSVAAGCNDYPGSRRITFSAFNDPSWNNCVKLQGTTVAPDGHWNNHIVIYMNWGLPQCRTSQVEIEHRTGAALAWVLGAPNWNEIASPWIEQILNNHEWSIANINMVYALSGQQLIDIYGSQA